MELLSTIHNYSQKIKLDLVNVFTIDKIGYDLDIAKYLQETLGVISTKNGFKGRKYLNGKNISRDMCGKF